MLGFWNRKKSIIDCGILEGCADNHSHILYGVDDGVKTEEDSIKILRFLEEAGVYAVWLTPHIMEDVPNTTEGLKARFADFCMEYDGPIKLHLAAEYMMDALYLDRLHKKDLLLHGGDRVLIETSTTTPPVDLWNIVEETKNCGYTPLLAHPERYGYLTPKDYDRLHDMGVLFQLNISSLAGVYGDVAQQRAKSLLAKEYYCMWGSDCHRYRAIEAQYVSKVLTKDVIEALDRIKYGILDA